MQYYIIHNNEQFGPLEIEELPNYGLNPSSMIWTAGMPKWVPAISVEEIRKFMENNIVTENSKYFIIVNNKQSGPYSIHELKLQNLSPETLVWKEDMPEWIQAQKIDELKQLFITNTPPPHIPPHTQTQVNYQPHNSYNTPNHFLLQQINDMRTWSIVMIVLGFLVSCLGGIFAIVAYSKANNARDFFNREMPLQAENSYTNAKTWFIVACVITGIGLISNIIGLISNIVNIASLW